MTSNCVPVKIKDSLEYCPINTCFVGKYHTLFIKAWIESIDRWMEIIATEDKTEHGRIIFILAE